jgi:cytochrome c
VSGRRFATGGSPGLYSEALLKAVGRWDDETLNAFLRDPQAVVPGTTMNFAGIRDETARAQTIDLLKSLR